MQQLEFRQQGVVYEEVFAGFDLSDAGLQTPDFNSPSGEFFLRTCGSHGNIARVIADVPRLELLQPAEQLLYFCQQRCVIEEVVDGLDRSNACFQADDFRGPSGCSCRQTTACW